MSLWCKGADFRKLSAIYHRSSREVNALKAILPALYLGRNPSAYFVLIVF
jgi:hypothetical protein